MRFTSVLKNIVKNKLVNRAEREVVIKVPWGNLTALSWGDPSNPPICLVHGRLDACSSFRPLVRSLPDSYFYVSIDLPGNGRSDHLPKGVRYSVMDLIPSMHEVMKHYKWEKFAFIGHSLGVLIGKYFNLAYPGIITKSVELDPVPAYFTWEIDQMDKWYNKYYEGYYGDCYGKINGGTETAPKYTYEKVEELMMKARGLSKEAISHVLERSLEPAGDGLYRITYDQGMKTVAKLPFTSAHLQKVFTSHGTPTFTILSQKSIQDGEFDAVPFIKNVECWPNKNYRVKIVDGNHDVHVENPSCIVYDIVQFLES